MCHLYLRVIVPLSWQSHHSDPPNLRAQFTIGHLTVSTRILISLQLIPTIALKMYPPIIHSLTAITITFLSIAAGQTTLTFDPSTIDLTTRGQWCQAEFNTCKALCSTTNSNSCDANTLNFTCTCASNNSAPGLQYYMQTMPTFICEENFKLCNAAAINAVNSSAAQAACVATEQNDCGHIDPANFTAAAATTSSITLSTISSLSSTKPQSTSISISTTTPSSSSSTTISTNSPQPSAQTHSGLSTGAKAGIGVGAAVVVLLFIIGLWLAFWYGRRTRSPAGDKQSKNQKNIGEKPELEASEARTAQIHEIGDPLNWDEKQELENRRRAAELDGESVIVRPGISERAELEARRRGDVFELS
ncbi:hypothetical protein N431DRAFT_181342 [Stipitochalara longipes BDJ]|nr:hypothetical protein N431DRAFT_181342 [Stipitochalara longipes BDJ]